MRPGFGHFGFFGGFGWIRLLFGSLVGLVLLIGLILLVVWAVRMATHRGSGAMYNPQRVNPQPLESPAVEILKARYAKGEITREQYQQMLEDIGKPTP